MSSFIWHSLYRGANVSILKTILNLKTKLQEQNLKKIYIFSHYHLKADPRLGWPNNFKCFRIYFSLKKRTIQIKLSFNLYFQQKGVSKLSIYHLPTKRSVWVFDATNRANGFSNFQNYHEVVTYIFNSLAESCTLFWKYSWTINRNNIFELTYYK